MIARDTMVIRIQLLARKKKRKKVRRMLDRQSFSTRREILRRASICRQSLVGVGFCTIRCIVWQGSTFYCGDKKRCISEIL